ncbi:MAG: 1-acyl-sn-glycerol-3-phosphate acyltransferase [Cocleimonas sp.]|nr:1-acyl-sn-glycerol-3-phosphate acyltransferase [Cocleimonas sp.]
MNTHHKKKENNHPLYLAWLALRSLVYWIGLAGITILAGLITPVLYLLPSSVQYKTLLIWSTFNIWLLNVACGIRYQVIGLEHVDLKHSAIILANHQSTWETMFIPTIFPRISWVLKKELYKIPFYGWALSLLNPIAIDRKAGKSAIEQVKINGKQRLDQGSWVCIFPQGTRVAVGAKSRYKKGGAMLASYSKYPVYPMAHNAGYCWPRNQFIKRPGLITVSIGAKIDSRDKTPAEINRLVQEWIENELTTLPAVR